MIQTFKGFLFNRCERHIGTGRVKSGRLDWENWVMCFRTQSTRNLTWSGVIRDFPRPLWQQQYQRLEKHEPQDMFPTWLPSTCYQHCILPTAYLTHTFLSPPLPSRPWPKSSRQKLGDKSGTGDHHTPSFALVWLKWNVTVWERKANLGLRAKNYFHNILAPLKVLHFSLSPWFRNLKV